jgi:methyl-accepting chemotaxis protein
VVPVVAAHGGAENARERERTRVSQLETLSRTTFQTTSFANDAELGSELQRQGALLTYDHLLWVDTADVVHGSATGQFGHKLAWPELSEMSRSKEATAFVAIIPPSELYSLGIPDKYTLALKKADGGSASATEVAGALAIVSLAPVSKNGKHVASIVGIDVLKLDNAFTDDVQKKLGGQATLFQNGVRVATTVRTAEKARAVGTPVSDKVRAAVLVGGEKFRGEAQVVGETYIAAYDPLRDSDGKIIGMMFTGIANAPYQAALVKFAVVFTVVLVLGLAVALTLGWFASGVVTRPIDGVVDAASRISDGDLTTNVPETGYREAIAMGSAFNAMTTQLRGVLQQVGTSATKLDTVSGEIAVASLSEAETASEQASSVAEATATIEELTRSFSAVADGARRVLEIAEDSLEIAEDGRTKVEGGAYAVQRLAGGSAQVEEAAATLAEVAESIDQVTYVIGSIAEQTKILALNAAIEAARAGESGKGFAVVSKEIRTLADSVTTSVTRIESLVHGIQSASKALSTTAGEQTRMAEDSVMSAMETRESLEGMIDQMSRTAAAAREIAAAAAQQQSAANQIVDVMHQVSQGVSGSAVSSRQLADSAGDVKRESEELSRGLGRFRTR